MSTVQLIARLALAIAVTLGAARLAARVASRLGQPPVVGEIIAGLLLGQTLLGAFPGDPSRLLFPHQVAAVLSDIAQVGVALYVLVVGLHLNLPNIPRSGRALLSVSLSSLLVPFSLGALLGAQLYGSHGTVAGKLVSPLAFTMFIGTAMATTAFPVLARILTDTGLTRTRIGTLAIGSAAIIDALGWVMLAGALAATRAGGLEDLWILAAEGIAFVAILLLVVRPLLGRLIAHQSSSEHLSPLLLATVLAATLACAAATNAIGLDAAVGAVLLGVLVPRDPNPALVRRLADTIGPKVASLLLPFFFLLPGLKVNLRTIGSGDLGELALILAVACLGKIASSAVATRAIGFPWRDAALMGALMNTRGLIELVILNAGFSAHVLDSSLYGMLVVMALTTTMMTGPLVNRLRRPSPVTALQPAP